MKMHLESAFIQTWSDEAKRSIFDAKWIKFEQNTTCPQYIISFLEIQKYYNIEILQQQMMS